MRSLRIHAQARPTMDHSCEEQGFPSRKGRGQ